jgi:hypothetical protein
MRTRCRKLAATIFGIFLLASAHAESDVRILYSEPLQQLHTTYAPASGTQKPAGDEIQALRFDAFGRRFDIALMPNRTLLGTEQRLALDSRVGIYRGDIANVPGSWVRLVIDHDVPRGMLWDGAEMWAIDVLADQQTGIDTPAIFRLKDLQVTPGALSCTLVSDATDAGAFAKAVLGELALAATQGVGATSQINVAVLGDFEFTTDKGAAVDTALITRMNNVDGIFSMQLGVQINVNRIDTFPDSNDPFSDATDSSALLVELGNYRNSTPAQNANGLSHLFTGRDLDGTTVGVAYTGALCSRRFGAGLTQGTHSTTLDSLITAHEMGHNFGAPHDGTAGSACESTPPDFLMAATLNGSDQFSACSITEMQDDVNRASCITALPATDVALVSGSQPPAALLGNAATITFDVNSVGTGNATGVNVNVTIPAAVSLNSVTTTSGSCTSGAGAASCAIGSVAAGSGATVTIDVSTISVGNADFAASVTADVDANSNNNNATVRLTVNPAVELVTTAAATAQIALDESVTIRPNVENRATIAASNVVLTVTPDAGLRIDSASWAAGTCSIAGNVLTCQAGSLAAGASDQLQIDLTGISEGNQGYAMSVTADEVDRNNANNSANGQVTVGSGSSGGNVNNSGGGSFGLLFLMLLALVACLRSDRKLPVGWGLMGTFLV